MKNAPKPKITTIEPSSVFTSYSIFLLFKINIKVSFLNVYVNYLHGQMF